MHPHPRDPVGGEIRIEAGQHGQERVQQFLLAHLEVWVVGVQVITQVDDVVAAIVFPVHVVGVFHKGEEGEALFLGQVDPIVLLGHAMFEGQGHHHRAHVAQVAHLLQVGGGQFRHHALEHGWGDGGDDHIPAPFDALPLDVKAPFRQGADAPRGSGKVHLAPQPLHPTHQGVHEVLEPAPEIAQRGAPLVDAGPEPGQVHLAVVLTELPYQKGFPQRLIGPTAHGALKPLVRGHPLELLPLAAEAQVGDDRAHARLVQHIQVGEEEHAQGGIERIRAAVLPHRGDGAAEEHVVADADFLRQADDVVVGLKQVVIELLQGPFPVRGFESCGQTTGLGCGFPDGDVVVRAGQVISSRKAGHAGPDDQHASFLVHSAIATPLFRLPPFPVGHAVSPVG